jgi:hypothetical protein
MLQFGLRSVRVRVNENIYELALAHRKTLEWEGHRVVCNDAMAGVLQATVKMSPASGSPPS